uniref:Uncharacterized protein n=1 Tax=Cannabis sativa TaxID=3483 RepID=A0A803NX17_CANSA
MAAFKLGLTIFLCLSSFSYSYRVLINTPQQQPPDFPSFTRTEGVYVDAHWGMMGLVPHSGTGIGIGVGQGGNGGGNCGYPNGPTHVGNDIGDHNHAPNTNPGTNPREVHNEPGNNVPNPPLVHKMPLNEAYVGSAQGWAAQDQQIRN